MTLLSRLAEKLLPTVAKRLRDRLLPVRRPRPEPEEKAFPLTHKHVRHIDEMIDRATSHGLVQGSPRAVTRDPRPTILPPRRR